MNKVTKKTKIALIITASVLLVITIIVGSFSIAFSVIGSKKQFGEATGYQWSKENDFEIKNVKSIDAGTKDLKILTLTDIHLKNHGTAAAFLGVNYLLDWTSANELNTLIKQTKPDLIVVTGDTTLTARNDIEYKRFVKFMDKFEVPWACVFGNHDDEGRADKAKIVDVLKTSKFGLFEFGPAEMHGAGNYVINLTRGTDIVYSLYMMDSGSNIEIEGKKKSDNINEKQNEWYKWNVEGINKADGSKVPSMAFFHIPVPQYALAETFIDGSRDEKHGDTADFGFFDTFKANGGTHLFAGHDHDNNFIANYKDIILTYIQKSSYNCYFKGGKTGGTLVTLKADNSVTLEIIDF